MENMDCPKLKRPTAVFTNFLMVLSYQSSAIRRIKGFCIFSCIMFYHCSPFCLGYATGMLERASLCEKALRTVDNNLDTLKHPLKMCNCLTFNLYICGYIFNKQFGKKNTSEIILSCSVTSTSVAQIWLWSHWTRREISLVSTYGKIFTDGEKKEII